MSNGAAGTLACSQVAAGEMNELRLRIYGEKGSLEWRQQDPNRLIVKWLDKPEEIHHAAASYLGSDARAVARTPAGHPEGLSGGVRGALSRVCRCADRVEAGEDESAAGDAAGHSSGRARNAVYRARDREQPKRRLGGVLECSLAASFSSSLDVVRWFDEATMARSTHQHRGAESGCFMEKCDEDDQGTGNFSGAVCRR